MSGNPTQRVVAQLGRCPIHHVGRGLQTPTGILREGLKTLAYIRSKGLRYVGLFSQYHKSGAWHSESDATAFRRGSTINPPPAQLRNRPA